MSKSNHSYLGFTNFENLVDARIDSPKTLTYGLTVYNQALTNLTTRYYQAKRANPLFQIPPEVPTLESIMSGGTLYPNGGIQSLVQTIQSAPNGDVNTQTETFREKRLELRKYEVYFFNELARLLEKVGAPDYAQMLNWSKEEAADDYLMEVANQVSNP